jgi:hypothetical protein
MLEPAPRELSTRRVLRDGAVVVMLRMLDHGGPVSVVTETFIEGPNGRESRAARPHRFRDRDQAAAFFDDAVGTFTYLGCDVQ